MLAQVHVFFIDVCVYAGVRVSARSCVCVCFTMLCMIMSLLKKKKKCLLVYIALSCMWVFAGCMFFIKL